VVPGKDEGDQTRKGMAGQCFQTGYHAVWQNYNQKSLHAGRKPLIRSLSLVSTSSSKKQFIVRKPITAVVNSLGLKLKNLFTILLRRVMPLVIQLEQA
jgi:hypothetical protein